MNKRETSLLVVGSILVGACCYVVGYFQGKGSADSEYNDAINDACVGLKGKQFDDCGAFVGATAINVQNLRKHGRIIHPGE